MSRLLKHLGFHNNKWMPRRFHLRTGAQFGCSLRLYGQKRKEGDLLLPLKNNARTSRHGRVLALELLWLPVLRTQRNIASGWHVVPVFCNSSDRNVIYTISPPNRPEKATPVSPVTLALAFQRMLDEGEVNSRSDLAKQVELTRARVTQILNLLNLPTKILDELATIHEPTQIAFYSERRLRPITQISSPKRQMAAFRKIRAQFDTNGGFPSSHSI